MHVCVQPLNFAFPEEGQLLIEALKLPDTFLSKTGYQVNMVRAPAAAWAQPAYLHATVQGKMCSYHGTSCLLHVLVVL